MEIQIAIKLLLYVISNVFNPSAEMNYFFMVPTFHSTEFVFFFTENQIYSKIKFNEFLKEYHKHNFSLFREKNKYNELQKSN